MKIKTEIMVIPGAPLEGLNPLPAFRPRKLTPSVTDESFPDDWKFCGGITDQYKQIGNAVPVEMARRIGVQLKRAILSETDMDDEA